MNEAELEKLISSSQELVTNYAIEYGLKVIAALVIFIIGRIIVALVAGGIKKALAAKQLDDTVVGFIYNLVYWTLY